MKRYLASILAAISLIGLLAASCTGGTHAPTPSPGNRPVPSIGSAAPGFTLPSAQGTGVSLSDFRGRKPVLLYFSMGPG